MMSGNSMLYERSIGKLDAILSYAGGLFGIIIATLSLFLMSFNEYRYELMAAESAFNYNDKGKKVREHDFTFVFYLKYEVFDWIKTLFGYELPWRDCKEVDETREEATEQLDVSLMFKRILYF